MNQFEYTTIQAVKDEGLDFADDKIKRLIKRNSSIINLLTSQWFSPKIGEFILDGNNSTIITHSNRVPIIEVNYLKQIFADGTTVDIGKDEYFVSERYLELEKAISMREYVWGTGSSKMYSGSLESSVNDITNFPARTKYKLKGALGWLEGFESGFTKKVSALTSAIVTNGATSVAYNTLAGGYFEVNDQVIIIDGTNVVGGIATAVSGTTISFEGLETPVNISSGSQIYSYGRTPMGIEMACLQLIIYNSAQMASEDFQMQDFSTRLTEEKTDNYSYKLSDPSGGNKTVIVTGSAQIDNILSHYMAPSVIGFV